MLSRVNVGYNILSLDLSTNLNTANPQAGSFLILHLLGPNKIKVIGCHHPFFFAAVFFFAAAFFGATSLVAAFLALLFLDDAFLGSDLVFFEPFPAPFSARSV